MTGTQELTIDIPPDEWLTANGRYHWRVKAKRTAALRHRAHMLARQANLTPRRRVFVTAHVSGRVSNRLDPANVQPTLKALIDGIVTDYGLLPDDDDDHLIGPLAMRGPKRDLPAGWHSIRLVFTDQTVPWMEGDAA